MKRITLLLSLFICIFTSNLTAVPDIKLMKNIVGNMSEDSIMSNLEILTGEKEAYIDGEKKLILSRTNNHEGNHLAARFIRQKFIDYGYKPVLNHYTYDTSYYKDKSIKYISPAEFIAVTVPGTEYPDKFIVICAHFDSASDTLGPGADDDGSGVVTVLEAARLLRNYKNKYSIVYACFDNEERGPSSAFAFVDSVKKTGVTYMQCLNVDMIGFEKDDNWETLVYYDTTHKAQGLADIISETGELLDLRTKIIVSDIFVIKDGVYYYISFGVGDDYAFNNNGYPAVTIIEQTNLAHFNTGYHTIRDKINLFNLPYFYDNVGLSIGSLITAAEVFDPHSFVPAESYELSVSDAYPNPGKSKICFDIYGLTADDYTIAIYDMLGREINGYKSKHGYNSITLDFGNTLVRGIYNCIFQTKTGKVFSKIFIICN